MRVEPAVAHLQSLSRLEVQAVARLHSSWLGVQAVAHLHSSWL